MVSGPKYIIGVDEVGRGPLAGPVVLAAVLIPKKIYFTRKLGELRDCKKLSPSQRELWNEYFRSHEKVRFAITRINPRGIERLNISQAANRAAYKAIKKLTCDLPSEDYEIALDGGLSLKRWLLSGWRSIIKGDEKITAIKIASILAKVQRDRFMIKVARKYPGYGFEKHKGYGTKEHREALKKLGPANIHRLTFLGKYLTIKI